MYIKSTSSQAKMEPQEADLDGNSAGITRSLAISSQRLIRLTVYAPHYSPEILFELLVLHYSRGENAGINRGCGET